MGRLRPTTAWASAILLELAEQLASEWRFYVGAGEYYVGLLSPIIIIIIIIIPV